MNELTNANTNELNDNVYYDDKERVYKRVASYERQLLNIPESDSVKVFNLLSGSENVIQLKTVVGEVIRVTGIITDPYTSVDEKTGALENGVITYMTDGASYYATSSKSVYWTLKKLVDTFGIPSDVLSYDVEITSTKRTNGDQINLRLVSINQ